MKNIYQKASLAHQIGFPLCSMLFCGVHAVSIAQAQNHSFMPKDGFVPDKATAVRIAEAVLMPVYGEEKIKRERPFIATLYNGIWTVRGSLRKGWKGGVAVAEIAKQDARVLSVSHGK